MEDCSCFGAQWLNDWQLLVLKEAVLHWSRKDSRRMGGKGKTVPQNGEGLKIIQWCCGGQRPLD